MKTLIAILILLSFLQATLIPINLVLIFLIVRAYIRPEETNLYLSFFFGVFVALLTHHNLGLYPIIFLSLVYLTHLLSRSPLSKNALSVIPLVVIATLIVELFTTLPFNKAPILMPTLVVAGILALPFYLIIKFWEERFVVRPQVKLKLK